MAKSKKVLIMIVEGSSDERALAPIKKWIKSKLDIRIEITRGDIFSDYKYKSESIKASIGNKVTMILDEYKLKVKDICGIIQITDTDGVFIENLNIIIDQSISCRKVYSESHILVQDEAGRNAMIERNETKSRKVRTMMSASTFTIRKVEIPYCLLYFSCNLDHVLHEESNMELTDKEQLARRFSRQFKDNPEAFKSYFFNENIMVNGSLVQTWSYIQQETNSLKRNSNFHLIFDLLQTLVEDER